MDKNTKDLLNYLKTYGIVGTILFTIVGLFNATTIPAFFLSLLTGLLDGCALGLNIWIVISIFKHFNNKNNIKSNYENKTYTIKENKSNRNNYHISNSKTYNEINDYVYIEHKEKNKVLIKKL